MQEQELLLLVAAAGILGLVLIGAVVYMIRARRRPLTLEQVGRKIAFDWQKDRVIDDGYDGEIQLDHLMLTSKGILVLDVKEAEGNVFGGERLDEWAVISESGRRSFRNPLAALSDKVAAVRRQVPEVPVSGFVLFRDQARFTKGRPQGVLKLHELDQRFAPVDKADQVLEAFRSHWERLLSKSRPAA